MSVHERVAVKEYIWAVMTAISKRLAGKPLHKHDVTVMRRRRQRCSPLHIQQFQPQLETALSLVGHTMDKEKRRVVYSLLQDARREADEIRENHRMEGRWGRRMH